MNILAQSLVSVCVCTLVVMTPIVRNGLKRHIMIVGDDKLGCVLMGKAN